MTTTTIEATTGREVYNVAGSSIDSTSPEQRHRLTVAERCLVWLSVLATIYSLYAARSIFVPIAIALVLALLLRPLVEWASRFVPRSLAALGALLVVAATGAGIIIPVYHQIDALGLTDSSQIKGYAVQVQERFKPILTIYEELETTTSSIDDSVVGVANPSSGNLDGVDPVDQMVSGTAAADTEPKRETVAVVEKQQPLIDTALGMGASFAANALVVVILMYFLLATGNELIGNVVNVTPGVQEKKRMGQLVRKVERGVSTYLSTITAINAGLGVCIAIAMWLLGMPAPWLIGLMATLFNFVPFIGAIVGMLVAGVVAVIVFPANAEGAFGFSGQVMWFLVPGTYFLLTNLEGNLVTPTLLGQTMKLNPVLVFLSLVFWGWIWGVAGALLAVPILAIIRTWCGHFESTRNFATLLGD